MEYNHQTMSETGPRSRKRVARSEPEEVTARILSYRRNYYVGRLAGPESIVDDEAALEVDAVIEGASPRHRKHVGQPIAFRLLHSERGDEGPSRVSAFSGSVTLRGQQRSMLAYLPEQPFWALPDLIERGADIVQCTFVPMSSGHGDMLSFYLGRRDEIEVTQP